MNNILASMFGFLNGLFALIIIVSGFTLGKNSVDEYLILSYPSLQGAGSIIGILIGVIVACLLCGFVALIITMRKELILIREALVNIQYTPLNTSSNRVEPTVE